MPGEIACISLFEHPHQNASDLQQQTLYLCSCECWRYKFPWCQAEVLCALRPLPCANAKGKLPATSFS